MPVITFWSNSEKAIGQTISASVAATTMAMEHNYKVLLMSADFNNNVIENGFGAQESNNEIIKSLVKKTQMTLDSGINGLLKLADSNRVTPESIHDYTKIIFKDNRLEVLYSPMNIIDQNNKLNIMEKMKNIILNAAKYYDMVFVDLRKGLQYNEQLEILKSSDIIVLNTNQEIKNIETIMNTNELKGLMNKTVWNICKYDKNSKYNSKNLSRQILKKQTICETWYNTLLFEAAQEGNIPELLLRYRTLKEEDNNVLFLSKQKELTEEILVKYQETRAKF